MCMDDSHTLKTFHCFEAFTRNHINSLHSLRNCGSPRRLLFLLAVFFLSKFIEPTTFEAVTEARASTKKI